jgi:hypothetical protein
MQEKEEVVEGFNLIFALTPAEDPDDSPYMTQLTARTLWTEVPSLRHSLLSLSTRKCLTPTGCQLSLSLLQPITLELTIWTSITRKSTLKRNSLFS